MKKILLLVLLFLSVFLVACSKGDLVLKEDLGLKSIRDESELKEKLKPKKPPFSFGAWFFSADKSVADDSDRGEAPEQGAASDGPRDYTKTNVQVEGVDEADIAKTDGNRIYSISHNYLQVVDILGEGKMEVVLSETLESVASNSSGKESSPDYAYRSTYFHGLYITNKYLVAIGQQYGSKLMTEGQVDSYYNYYYTNETVVYLYDIHTLDQLTSFTISGSLNDTRLIDDRLYAISSYTPYYDENHDLRPYVGEADDVEYVEYRDIKYLDDFDYRSYTLITMIDLDEEPVMETDTFLGQSSWGQVYVNEKGIYFATYIYHTNWLGSRMGSGVVVSYTFDQATGRVKFGGSGEFSGNILNQFAMDEYNGYFRLATSEGWGEATKNRIYVFERKVVDSKYQLVVVGLLDKGLGKPGEQIKSVRFNKDAATVVTFVQTDPFYTIDLSDPTKPTIKGELFVTGYSAYQHPWGEGYVLGIGFEGVGNNLTGMKLSLYDIRDFNNPVEVGKPFLFADSRYSYSEALYNHKALMVDIENGYFGFSVWVYDYSSYYYRNTNEYVVFSVNPESETPITKEHTVSHRQFFEQEINNKQYYYDLEIRRGIRIDDYLYVISGEVISSHNLTGEFGLVDHVMLKENSR